MRQKLNGINNTMLALPSGSMIVMGSIIQVTVPRAHRGEGRGEGDWYAERQSMQDDALCQ